MAISGLVRDEGAEFVVIDGHEVLVVTSALVWQHAFRFQFLQVIVNRFSKTCAAPSGDREGIILVHVPGGQIDRMLMTVELDRLSQLKIFQTHVSVVRISYLALDSN